ncbi:MAG: sulfite exporter TauE/SafE family protein [Betaproteobacteria bacterium]|nr:sulfite exporter TauE/SafE family protein [Betaproteobacteria bacterium]
MIPAAWLHDAVLLGAAFFGAALNAVAGGGSFLTLPALLWAGVPAVSANATGTAALLPGYLASAWGFREDMGAPRALGLRGLLSSCLLGGLIGAGLLVSTSDHVFRALVPALLLFATFLFAFSQPLLRMVGRGAHDHTPGWVAWTGMFAVSVYGGYFNGGLGVLLLALFGLIGETDLNRMNGLKNAVSALLTVFALVIYAAAGSVHWSVAGLMIPAVLLGGYFGARVARLIPRKLMRWGIVAIGLIMALLFMR